MLKKAGPRPLLEVARRMNGLVQGIAECRQARRRRAHMVSVLNDLAAREDYLLADIGLTRELLELAMRNSAAFKAVTRASDGAGLFVSQCIEKMSHASRAALPLAGTRESRNGHLSREQ